MTQQGPNGLWLGAHLDRRLISSRRSVDGLLHELSFRHRSGPLELLAGYTWSKSIDDSSGWGDQINVVNQRLGRVISSFDVPQNFVVSYHYDLAFDKLRRNRLTSGWVITGITRFSTGLPVTLTERGDNSLLGTFCTGPNCGEVDTPNYLGGSLRFHDPRSLPGCLRRTSLAVCFIARLQDTDFFFRDYGMQFATQPGNSNIGHSGEAFGAALPEGQKAALLHPPAASTEDSARSWRTIRPSRRADAGECGCSPGRQD